MIYLKDDKFLKKQLLVRGWTDKLIKELLPVPRKIRNINHYGYSLLWDKADVYEAERNEKFQERYEKFIKAKQSKEQIKSEKIFLISNDISIKNPALGYPNARKIRRHFIFNVGETNTGKTYTALQKLKSSEKGIYLSPLRLLALEIQDSLNNEGYPCSLLTGEEENIVQDSKFMSSTVEKLDLFETYEVGIIDECQMIEDKFRGGAWTRAILGLCANTIYLCMSENAIDICRKLVELCGDTYEINKYERNTPLKLITKHEKVENLEVGDAIVLFSRKKVLEYARDLEMLGYRCSVIYGALPYYSRKYQIEQYRNKITDILVATDAIGMGLNLPIRRVLFGDTSKYDGETNRLLTIQEVKQISGRAGRQGIYDEGFVTSFEFGNANLGHIERCLKNNLEQIVVAKIPFPEVCVNETQKVSKTIKLWNEVVYPDIFIHECTSELLFKVKYLEKEHSNLDNKTIFRLATVMFDTNNQNIFNIWCKFVRSWTNNKTVNLPMLKDKSLESLEEYYKILDLYYSFCKSMHIVFDEDVIRKKREFISNLINEKLTSNKEYGNKCSRCGKEYKRKGRINVCDKCRQRIKARYQEDKYDYDFWY